MEKERSSKIIAIIALCVGVVGLSIGMAAFASNLVIQPSASVSPSSSEFNIVFSNAAKGAELGGAVASTPTISQENITLSTTGKEASASVIRGLSATFTGPGQKVTYTFDAQNAGKYIAYLNSVVYSNATGKSAFKTCTAGTGTTASLVESACNDIQLKLTIRGKEYSTTNETITNHTLAVGSSDIVIVEIEYVLKGTDEAPTNTLADGDFTVNFGSIELLYGSTE